MTEAIIRVIAILDFVLIMMTAVWIMVSISRGMSELDLWYNYTYVILNILTLFLNLKLLKSKP